MRIEIGTSDFRTEAGKVEGIYIEPVKYYFDRLPDNCTKIQCAISNEEGTAVMYSVNPVLLDSQMNWVRGCNSMNAPHPTIDKMGIDTITERVPVRRIKSIIDEYNVREIDTLKIDTEGHDTVILNDFLDTVDILPSVIQFEANELSDSIEVSKLAKRITEKGYDCRMVKTDMVCRLT